MNLLLFLGGTYLMPIFKTIRQTASTGLISEHQLRLMVAQDRCPGIWTGNRFMVNVDALAEQLDAESRRCMDREEVDA